MDGFVPGEPEPGLPTGPDPNRRKRRKPRRGPKRKSRRRKPGAPLKKYKLGDRQLYAYTDYDNLRVEDYEWHPIPNTLGAYEMTRCGLVRKVARRIRNARGVVVNQKECVLRPSLTGGSHWIYTIYTANVGKSTKTMKTLLEWTFGVSEPENGRE